MQFDEEDLDAMLDATGEPVDIQFGGVVVKTIRAKFRKNYQDVSPYDSTIGILLPAITCKSSDMSDVSSSNVFVVQGVEYTMSGKPEAQSSGLTLVKLGIKK